MKLNRKLEVSFSSGSGLALLNQILYCVCDSENSLYYQEVSKILSSQNEVKFSKVALGGQQGPLPKKQKSDWESLSVHENSLWLWPSFSKSHRVRLCQYQNGNFRNYQLSNLYLQMKKFVEEPNIEGNFFASEKIWLFQRGNSSHQENGYFVFPQSEFQLLLANEKVSLSYEPVHLGSWQNELITWSEACLFSETEVLVSGVVEKTLSPYEDGDVLGSRIGLYDIKAGQVQWLFEVEKLKIEGLARSGEWVFAVTDADDESKNSSLLLLHVNK